MGMELLWLLMVGNKGIGMKDSFKIIISMVKEFTTGSIATNFKGKAKIIREIENAYFILTIMVTDMKGSVK